MTLSTIEKHYLRKELMNIHLMTESMFYDNLPASTVLTSENVNTLIDRRDHIMDKIQSLTKVIEQ